MPEGPAGRRERYEAASDPILRFVVDYLEDSTVDDMVLKGDAYSVYTTMCDRDDERPAAEDAFKRKLSQQTTVDVENAQTRQLTPGDSREWCWKYVRFTDAAKSLMSDRLTERYFPGSEQVDVDEPAESDTQDGQHLVPSRSRTLPSRLPATSPSRQRS
jgi:phage/plasmid-associated DNA primase